MAVVTFSSSSLQYHQASPWIDVGRCYNGLSLVKTATAQALSSYAAMSTPFSSGATSLSTEGVRLQLGIDAPSMEGGSERVKLPELSCSFSSMVHPQYEQVKLQCDKWIEGVAELSSSIASGFLQQCLFPRLVCRFIPKVASSRQRLLQAIKLVAWLMIVHDDDDPGLVGVVTDYASNCYRAERIMAILTQPADAFQDRRLWNFDLLDCRLSKRCSRQLAALADLWLEIYPEMSPLLRSRFTSSMANYLEGIKMQAWLRKAARVPIINMDSYMKIRRQASFSIPAFIMTEYASGLELDQATLEHAKVVELRTKAVDYVCLCNDIFSCYAQMGLVGEYDFNLPSILQYNAFAIYSAMGASTKTGICFQRAIDHVAQLAQDLDACCTSLVASLKDQYSKPYVDPLKAHHMHAYVDIIALGMSGALAWLYETPRYAHNHAKVSLML